MNTLNLKLLTIADLFKRKQIERILFDTTIRYNGSVAQALMVNLKSKMIESVNQATIFYRKAHPSATLSDKLAHCADLIEKLIALEVGVENLPSKSACRFIIPHGKDGFDCIGNILSYSELAEIPFHVRKIVESDNTLMEWSFVLNQVVNAFFNAWFAINTLKYDSGKKGYERYLSIKLNENIDFWENGNPLDLLVYERYEESEQDYFFCNKYKCSTIGGMFVQNQTLPSDMVRIQL